MRFPYTRIGANLPPRPYVSVFFRVGCATTDTLVGLVDSGADYPILPSEFADTLKLNLAEGIPWNFTGTTGKLQIAYLHNVEMSVWGADDAHLAFRFGAQVAFCPDFKFAGGLLLGQEGFLSNFTATFQQRDNYFDLEPLDGEIVVAQEAGL